MSYIIEQKIGNHIYLYEVQSYWDREKKQSRQKRKYLGKKDPETGQAIQPRKGILPRLSKDYGHVYLLQKLASRLGLNQILQQIFPLDYQTILALAFFEISEAKPLYLFSCWAESTCLDDVKPLRSNKLSEFTQKMGQMEKERRLFSERWIHRSGPVDTVVFDITSISSYSTLFDDVEWGYNRDSEKLPQINLGIIYGETTHLPLHYWLYPGSIRDVSTLTNVLKYLELFGLKEILFVLDRGFYSAANLSKMDKARIKCIIPMPMTVKLFSKLLSNHKRKFSNPVNAFALKSEVLFHSQEAIEIENVPIQAHLYFNEQSRSDQTSRFLKKLLDIEAAIKKENFQSKKKAVQYLSTNFKRASKFFQLDQTEGGVVTINRKPRTISRAMTKMGTTILLTNKAELSQEKIMILYRQKDALEKLFDVLKNEFDGKRLRAQSKDAVEGRLFIKFISLILYAEITRIMNQKDLFKKYTITEIMYELKKVKSVEMNNGKSYLTEISKRQREIFKKFDVAIPVKT